MKALVGFLVLVLCCSHTQAQNEQKCLLKEKFQQLQAQHQVQGLPENVVAKLICHVEKASGFNSSAVNTLDTGTDGGNRRKRNIYDIVTMLDLTTTAQPQTTTPNRRGRRSTNAEVWTLYGYFQLSNHLVCTDGTTPSINMCNLECSSLIDDDLEDDINCVLDICYHVIQNGWEEAISTELIRMIRLIFQEECRDETYDHYFAECM